MVKITHLGNGKKKEGGLRFKVPRKDLTPQVLEFFDSTEAEGKRTLYSLVSKTRTPHNSDTNMLLDALSALGFDTNQQFTLTDIIKISEKIRETQGTIIFL